MTAAGSPVKYFDRIPCGQPRKGPGLADLFFPATVAGMNSHDLIEAQVDAILARLRPTLGYLGRLERRMEDNGFPRDDEMLLLTREARKATHLLTVAMHYTGCRGQVGRSG